MDTGSCSSIRTVLDGIPNAGVVNPLKALTSQFAHLNVATGVPVSNTMSPPDYRVIVSNPSTGMTRSIPLHSSGTHNVTYTIPSASIPSRPPCGTPISASREIPVSIQDRSHRSSGCKPQALDNFVRFTVYTVRGPFRRLMIEASTS